MWTAIWNVFAVAVLLGIFAACVIVVATGVRVLEGMVEKRQHKQTE
jgi:hypothetical protein